MASIRSMQLSVIMFVPQPLCLIAEHQCQMPHCSHQSGVDAKRRHDNAQTFKEDMIRLL
jgi:hypothetical protein